MIMAKLYSNVCRGLEGDSQRPSQYDLRIELSSFRSSIRRASHFWSRWTQLEIGRPRRRTQTGKT